MSLRNDFGVAGDYESPLLYCVLGDGRNSTDYSLVYRLLQRRTVFGNINCTQTELSGER